MSDQLNLCVNLEDSGGCMHRASCCAAPQDKPLKSVPLLIELASCASGATCLFLQSPCPFTGAHLRFHQRGSTGSCEPINIEDTMSVDPVFFKYFGL